MCYFALMCTLWLLLLCNPDVSIVAGGHLNITEAFGSLEEHLQRLQPDPADAATPPAQPWLDGLLTGMRTSPPHARY